MKNISMEERVWVENLCAWDLYFKRLEGHGDVRIPAKGRTRLERLEIQAQVYNKNPFFVGVDEKGSHAKIFIDDKDTRVLVGFESDDTKEEQNILTKKKIEKILNYKTMGTFKKYIKENVVTNAEKAMLIDVAKSIKLNDYEKIQFIEEYTGLKFDE